MARMMLLEKQGASEATRNTANLVAQARIQDITRLQATIETIERERDYIRRMLLSKDTRGAHVVLQFASRHV